MISSWLEREQLVTSGIELPNITYLSKFTLYQTMHFTFLLNVIKLNLIKKTTELLYYYLQKDQVNYYIHNNHWMHQIVINLIS